MSHTIAAFNTLNYSKKLIKAGFSPAQAEAQTQALAEVVDHQLATKQDLKELKQELKQDIKLLRQEVKQDLKSLEFRLLTKLGGFIALLAALMKLFH